MLEQAIDFKTESDDLFQIIKTLTDDDLEKISSDLINVIDTKLSGSLRSQ